jgi:ryanodine receptor 2
MKEGWTYGPERNDGQRRHPDLVPYSALAENEKNYDRLMAMTTIRLLKKLGFDIVKR